MDKMQVDIKRRGIILGFRHDNMPIPNFIKKCLSHI